MDSEQKTGGLGAVHHMDTGGSQASGEVGSAAGTGCSSEGAGTKVVISRFRKVKKKNACTSCER